MSEVLTALVRANVVACVAILAVLALRCFTRRLFGTQVAYQLWLVVPFAFFASFLPAAQAQSEAQAVAVAATLAALLPTASLQELLNSRSLMVLWTIGAGLATGFVGLSQMHFLMRAKSGRAGPAMVGIIAPRMVIPHGYQDHFSLEERMLVRAHERAHVDRGDLKVNAAMTLFQCLLWFNPLVHIAAALARQDQELACDATVIATRPQLKKLYAATLLKTQLTRDLLPLGCHWGSASRHPLEDRITLLSGRKLSERRRHAGGCGVLVLSLCVAVGAWAAQVPQSPRSEKAFIPLPLRQTFEFEGHPSIVMIRLSAVEVASLPQPPSTSN